MDIQKIEMLLRAIELGSLSKAADEYLYTPSAFSHMASAVENEIGAKIIKRSHLGIEVENKEIVEKLRKMCELKNDIFEIAGKNLNKNCLTIGTYASLAKNVLPAVIKGFRNENRGIHINITVCDNITKFMESDGADVYFGERPNIKNCVWTQLLDDPFMAVFPKGAQYNIFSPDKKYSRAFVVPNESKTRSYINRNNFSETIEVNSHDDGLVISMVETEGAISVLPKLSLLNCGDGVKIAPLEKPFSRTLGIAYKNILKNSKMTEKFIEYLKNYKIATHI